MIHNLKVTFTDDDKNEYAFVFGTSVFKKNVDGSKDFIDLLQHEVNEKEILYVREELENLLHNAIEGNNSEQ